MEKAVTNIVVNCLYNWAPLQHCQSCQFWFVFQNSVPSCRGSGWPGNIWHGGEHREGGDSPGDKRGVQCSQVCA